MPLRFPHTSVILAGLVGLIAFRVTAPAPLRKIVECEDQFGFILPYTNFPISTRGQLYLACTHPLSP